MIKRSLSFQAGNIQYLEAGSGQHLLFLHGAFATPYAYEPLLELLSGSYHVIAPTHSGHGMSFKISPEWSYDDYIETYTDFISRLSFDPSVIVGHSFGGAISLCLGLKFTHAKVVALDAIGLPFPFVIKDFLTALIKEGDDAFKHNPNTQTLQELGRAAGALVDTFGKHPENIPWFYTHGATLDLTKTLALLKNPVGLLWGEADKVVPLSVGTRIHTLVSHSILKTYPGYEHNYPITQPVFTHKEIIEMISLIGVCDS